MSCWTNVTFSVQISVGNRGFSVRECISEIFDCHEVAMSVMQESIKNTQWVVVKGWFHFSLGGMGAAKLIEKFYRTLRENTTIIPDISCEIPWE